MGLYHHFQTVITFSNPYSLHLSLKQSHKTPVKKDLMKIILFRTYEHLKLNIIICIFHVLITFYIYQAIHSFPNKFNSLPSTFRKCFQYNSEDKVISRFFFDAQLDC